MKFASTDVKNTVEIILDQLHHMEALTSSLLKASQVLDSNMKDDVSKMAIDMSNEMISLVAKAREITLSSTSTVREVAQEFEKIEDEARKLNDKGDF